MIVRQVLGVLLGKKTLAHLVVSISRKAEASKD